MSYSRWGSPGLGWYIYHDVNGKLFVSPGCPRDLGCARHTQGAAEEGIPCLDSEFLSKERVIMLKECLEAALEEWDS